MTRRPSFLSWLVEHAPALCRAAAYFAVLSVAAPVVYHVARGSNAYMGLFEDDYFYYAIIADKLVTRGLLTFDGVTITNGFHPLWFAIVFVVRLVFGRFGFAYHAALATLFVACGIATYEFSRRLACALGASTLLAPLIAVVYAVGSARLLCTGMECAVAIPLLLWLLAEAAVDEEMTARRAAKLGVIAGLATLARLDIGMIVILLVGAWAFLERPPLARAARMLAVFSLGMLPVLAYAALNAAYFGSILPVSALAKQLLVSRGFGLWYAYTIAFFTLYGPTIGVVLPAGVVALFVLQRRAPHAGVRARVVGGIALFFAFVFFAMNATTGWVFFSWYAYPLAPATIAALVFVSEALAPRVSAGRLAAVLAVAAAFVPPMAARYFVERGPEWTLADSPLAASSVELASRMHDRRGLYAMGAICGMAAYALDAPFVQAEGLVADRAMVEHVRHQEPLTEVLESYGVDYLVVSYVPQEKKNDDDGCYLVDQPSAIWSGRHSAKMHARICGEPLVHFTTPRGTKPRSLFPELQTYVFDVHAARKQERGVTGL